MLIWLFSKQLRLHFSILEPIAKAFPGSAKLHTVES